jgi:hypothetical protein
VPTKNVPPGTDVGALPNAFGDFAVVVDEKWRQEQFGRLATESGSKRSSRQHRCNDRGVASMGNEFRLSFSETSTKTMLHLAVAVAPKCETMVGR